MLPSFYMRNCRNLWSRKYTGYREQFLIHGVNGFEFESNSPESLLKAMKMMANIDSEKLNEMSTQSHNLGLRITAENWAEQVLSFLNGIKV